MMQQSEGAPDTSDTNQQAVSAKTGNDKSASGTETILLVDDDDLVRDLGQEILELNGYSFLTANNGREALQLCADRKGPIDLLITDVMMPEMGGTELVERLRLLRPVLKVLFTSGYPDLEHNGTLNNSGVNFIQKPFSPRILANKVREILDSHAKVSI